MKMTSVKGMLTTLLIKFAEQTVLNNYLIANCCPYGLAIGVIRPAVYFLSSLLYITFWIQINFRKKQKLEN